MCRSEQGFTLLEIVLGIAVLGIIVLSVTNFVGSSFAATEQAGRITRAAALAQGKMELLRASSYEGLLDLQAGPGGDGVFPYPGALPGQTDLQCLCSITPGVLELDGYPVTVLRLEVSILRRGGNQVARLTSFVHAGS